MYIPDDPDLYTYLIATWPFLFSRLLFGSDETRGKCLCDRERHRRKRMLSPSVIFVVVKQALKRSV